MNCIELENVKLSYENKSVLTDVNLAVPSGKVYALAGPNGCGKTSLLRVMAGLIRPAFGNVTLLGNRVVRTESVKGVSFLFEPTPIDERLSAKQNLKLKCCISGVSTRCIKALLEEVGLRENNKLVKSYSIGMKRRLEIAYALIGNPELLILDEPFNGLDIGGIDILKRIIDEFKNRGKSVFIAEHNPAIEKIADCFAILYDGKIINTVASDEIGLKYPDLEAVYKDSVAEYEKIAKI